MQVHVYLGGLLRDPQALVKSVYVGVYKNNIMDVVIDLTGYEVMPFYQGSDEHSITFAFIVDRTKETATVTLVAENQTERELIKQQQFSNREKNQIVYRFEPWIDDQPETLIDWNAK